MTIDDPRRKLLEVTLDAQLENELEALAARARLRSCPPVTPGGGAAIDLEGRPLVSFCSNDYLGLAHEQAVREAAAGAVHTWGPSASASRLVVGDHPAVRALEGTLATAFSAPAALVFPTGYQANIGLLTSLLGPEDLVLSDALNHASLIDGCRLSRARICVYPHADAQAALTRAHQMLAQSSFRRVFLVTESVFSMDGDVAPLAALAHTCQRLGAHLLVDEAHAFGSLGPRGQGLCAQLSIQPYARVGTLGKAFAASGGFVLGSATLCRYLTNKARTFIFTTGLAPALAAAAHAALRISQSAQGDALRRALHENVRTLQAALGRPTDLPSPILPFVLGSDARAVSASQALTSRGLFVQAIRPPTVPEGTARLRLTLSSRHAPAQVEQLARALSDLPTDAGHA